MKWLDGRNKQAGGGQVETGEQMAISRGGKQCVQRPGGKNEGVVVGSQRSGWLEYGVDQGVSLLRLL